MEGFWALYSYIERSDKINNCEFHIFKNGIKPMWEDGGNKRGGKIALRLRKGLAARLWEQLLLGVIGEQFEVDGHEVRAVLLLVLLPVLLVLVAVPVLPPPVPPAPVADPAWPARRSAAPCSRCGTLRTPSHCGRAPPIPRSWHRSRARSRRCSSCRRYIRIPVLSLSNPCCSS